MAKKPKTSNRINKGIVIAAQSKVCPKWQQTPGMYLAGRAALDDADALQMEMERKWGAGRLRLLVSPHMREKFDRQRYLTKQAIWEGELEDVKREGARMAAAWKALDKAATSIGKTPLPPTVWETTLEDGKVIAIVREAELINQVSQDGREMAIFTVDEVAKLMFAFPEICAVKSLFPGAKVESAKERINDPFDDIINEPTDTGINDVKPPIDGVDGFDFDVGDDIPF